ncbi:membrane-associated proteins in eicosanoid and glutathione metabolism [Rhizopogon salebrosus TDB-379]|nr:membrane-associated proteins in eicosanoid and glutathione metabolism [Rhizopogon salebrosus TDB-379]
MSPSVFPPDYGYVAAGFVCTAWLLGWQAVVVNSHRTKSGIQYPQLYAEKAEAAASKEAFLFNCAQRAHQNTIEHMPLIIVTTLVTAMKHPVFAGYACGFWAVSRVLYTIGYTTGDPAKRNTRGGIIGELPLAGLLLGSTYTAFDLLRSSS